MMKAAMFWNSTNTLLPGWHPHDSQIDAMLYDYGKSGYITGNQLEAMLPVNRKAKPVDIKLFGFCVVENP